MPRPKRNYTNKRKESELKKDVTVNLTVSDMNPKMVDIPFKFEMWKSELKDTMKDAVRKLTAMQKEKVELLEFEFKNALSAIPNNVLKTVIDINSEDFYADFFGTKKKTVPKEEKVSTTPVAVTAIKRRSRSASNIKYSTRASQRTHRLRSTSVDMFKTPRGKVRLSTIMSSKKYTVSKPKKAENSGVHVRRVMRPDEEAISTCGSPLYVASCTMGAPHVNIPLPGGVVLNIEPKQPKGPLEVPGLDAKTKSQIKLLCEQLNKLF